VILMMAVEQRKSRIVGDEIDLDGAKWCLSPRFVVFNVTALTYWRADHCYSVLVFEPLDPQPGATSMGRSTALAR
jgi:hypothetical protein